MKNNLVIVESPAKASTIAKYLGDDYTVLSSFGHIRDLPKKGLNIDKENDFAPNYEVPEDKKKVVNNLRKSSKQAKTIWLASDEDREGEAIAWHLCKVLNLPEDKTKRIVFHEITEPAIKQSIKNPRTIDLNLVNAQQARRVLDRLVGYELSPIVWKKIKPGLSAGRVQSIAVSLIVDREREIKSFESKSDYKITAELAVDKINFLAELNERLKNRDDVLNFLNKCQTAKLSVESVVQKPSERNPSAPFTTSTLQQEASRKLGFSVKQTMTMAQKLYENGQITYMRTDSTNISDIALQSTQDYITNNFGPNYYKKRIYQTKNKSAQEAHEAIRPTNISLLEVGENQAQHKLYKLIWNRMVASQMAAARTLKTEAQINIDNSDKKFVAKGEILQFDGFLKVYGGGKNDSMLPDLIKGQNIDIISIQAKETFSHPPARYSEATLVKKLEELGIGRPSTYAPTISTIQSRGYIEKADLEGKTRQISVLTLKNNKITDIQQEEKYGADNNKLLPTHLAEVTTDFLKKYFSIIMDTGFTANIEKEFDDISEGKAVWQKTIKSFYEQFHPLISSASGASRHETLQARLLGTDPGTKKPIFARYGKYGPMLQRGEVTDENKPQFAPMPEGTSLEEVSLEQALKMFSLPRTVGKTDDGQKILANIGRFGPYIQVGKTFVSIKPFDPFSINEADSIRLYKEKLDNKASKEIKIFKSDKISILKGPFGPYITDGKKNARIPKDVDPKEITVTQAKEILASAKPKRYKKRSK